MDRLADARDQRLQSLKVPLRADWQIFNLLLIDLCRNVRPVCLQQRHITAHRHSLRSHPKL